MLANGAKETTTTTGTGTVTLSAVTGFPRFSQVLSVGQFVDYAIQDGNNWEWGVGKVAASNTLERTLVTAKFDGGTYSKDPATRLSLSGSATVFCAITDATCGIAYSGPLAGSWVPNALIVQQTAYLQSSNFNHPDKVIFSPWAWPAGVDRVAKGARIRVGTVGTATKMRIGVLQYGATQSGNVLITQTADIDVTSTGVKSASFLQPVALPLARYGLCVILNGTCTLLRAEGFVPDMSQLSSTNPYGRRAVTDLSFAGWTELTNAMITAFASGNDTPEQIVIQLEQP